ncbi:fatty acid desaturase family protein [Microbacterium sp. NPDC055683]
MSGIRETVSRGPRSERPRGSEFTALADQIRSQGLLRRRYGYYWVRLILLPIALVGCVVVFILLGDTWWQLFTAVVFAAVLTQLAFLGHDAAHRQIFSSGRWNDWTSIVLADLLVGMSYSWWQHKHTRHHANPNKEGSDPDIDLPVIALTREQRAVSHGPILTWLRAHQGAFFFPLLLLEGLSLHASGVRRVIAREHVDRRWIEIAFLVVRLVGFNALIFLVLSPGIAFAFLGVQLGLFGVYMGMSFAPNHKGMPIVPHDVKLDFLRRQVLMSRNIRGGRFVDALMGGLNHQIEHHLFPSMPRPHLRKAAPIVADYCRTHGIPYAQTSLVASYAIVVRYINRVGLGERDVFRCPIAAQYGRD